MNGVVYHRIYTPHLRMQLDGQATIDVCQSQEEWMTVDFSKYDLVVFGYALEYFFSVDVADGNECLRLPLIAKDQ